MAARGGQHRRARRRHRSAGALGVLDAYREAPRFQPKAKLITGVVWGGRIEDIGEKTMRRLRYLDKLIDELAKGKPMAKILRT